MAAAFVIREMCARLHGRGGVRTNFKQDAHEDEVLLDASAGVRKGHRLMWTYYKPLRRNKSRFATLSVPMPEPGL